MISLDRALGITVDDRQLKTTWHSTDGIKLWIPEDYQESAKKHLEQEFPTEVFKRYSWANELEGIPNERLYEVPRTYEVRDSFSDEIKSKCYFELPKFTMSKHQRFTTAFKLAKTNTFRLGSAKLWGSKRKDARSFGGNMQNWEKSTRSLAIADDGMSFAQADQAGAEALIVAYLCPPGRFRDLFLHGIKPHVYLGVFFPEHWIKQFPMVHEFAKTPIAELKNHPNWPAFAKAVAASDGNPSASRYYYFYKTTCHSGNYGVKENTFVEGILAKSGGKVVISPATGAKFLSTYRDIAFPELHIFHRYVEQQIERHGMLRNLFGFPRKFRKLKFDEKEAYAFIPQSTVGCITNVAVTKMTDFIIENDLHDWIVLNNCHDSFLVQAPDQAIKQAAAKMTELLNQDLVGIRGEKFKMRSEVKIGKNWGDYNEKYNPQGLK